MGNHRGIFLEGEAMKDEGRKAVNSDELRPRQPSTGESRQSAEGGWQREG